MSDFDYPPHATTAAQHVGRPPLSKVPMHASRAVWAVEVPGPGGGAIGAYYEEHVAKILPVECSACSLWYRAYEDDPRPCPGCSRPPAPEFPMRELEAARRVVSVVRRQSHVSQALALTISEYEYACGGPAAAEKIMEQVEKEQTR